MTRDELVEKATRAYFVHATGPEAMKAAINVVLEAAAKVCDEADAKEREWCVAAENAVDEVIYDRGAYVARINAAAIRALKGKA